MEQLLAVRTVYYIDMQEGEKPGCISCSLTNSPVRSGSL